MSNKKNNKFGQFQKGVLLGSFRGRRNFGDILNRDVLEYFNVKYEHSDYVECNFLAIGSVLQNIVSGERIESQDNVDVWGSGFISPKETDEFFVKKARIHALRGEYSKKRCEDILGFQLSNIPLGDPGLLVSRIYKFNNIKKKFDVGIIPHYVDKNSEHLKNIILNEKKFTIIDVQDDPVDVCKKINQCKMILSSAMHGLIAADSYGIPNKWIRLSDSVVGDHYKFKDYYSIYDIYDIHPTDLRVDKISDEDIDSFIADYPISADRVSDICEGLKKSFPFKNNPIEHSSRNNKEAISFFEKAAFDLESGLFEKVTKNIDFFKSHLDYSVIPRHDNRHSLGVDISVIVVAYNTNDDLLKCIDSLFDNNIGEIFELIVVDNGKNEKVKSEVMKRELLYVESPYNFLPSEGRNMGVHFAQGEIVVFLDDDALVCKNYISSIRSAFEKFSIIGLRGKILPKTDSANNKFATHYDLGDNDKYVRYINIEGNSAFKRKEYLECGGFNPALFGHEAIELSYRLERRFGLKKMLYSASTIIKHDLAHTDKKFDTKRRRHDLMREYLKNIHPCIEIFMKDLDNKILCSLSTENCAELSEDLVEVIYDLQEEINTNYWGRMLQNHSWLLKIRGAAAYMKNSCMFIFFSPKKFIKKYFIQK